MLIQNYGLFWRLHKVDWGSQGKGNTGNLLGRPALKRTDKPVNFRNQEGVYVLYDDTFKIIYVGQAGSGDQKLFTRLRGHRRDHLAERWSRFSWFGLNIVKNGLLTDSQAVSTNTPQILNHIEAIMIAAAEPPLNLQSGRFGKAVDKYLQFFEADKTTSDEAE